MPRGGMVARPARRDRRLTHGRKRCLARAFLLANAPCRRIAARGSVPLRSAAFAAARVADLFRSRTHSLERPTRARIAARTSRSSRTVPHRMVAQQRPRTWRTPGPPSLHKLRVPRFRTFPRQERPRRGGGHRELLRECRVLMRAIVTPWRWDRDDQLPDGRYWGIEGLNEVRVALDPFGMDVAD